MVHDAGRAFDEWLVLLAQSGDRRAVERLAVRWGPRLLRTARRMTGEAEAARDAAQDAWAGILAGLPRLHDPAAFPAWAFGILRRKCADALRRRARARAREAPLEAASDAAAPQADGEGAADFKAALARLPVAQAEVVALFYGEGLTLAEIAAATGVPVGTAKSRLFHARAALKATLAGGET